MWCHTSKVHIKHCYQNDWKITFTFRFSLFPWTFILSTYEDTLMSHVRGLLKTKYQWTMRWFNKRPHPLLDSDFLASSSSEDKDTSVFYGKEGRGHRWPGPVTDELTGDHRQVRPTSLDTTAHDPRSSFLWIDRMHFLTYKWLLLFSSSNPLEGIQWIQGIQ